MKSLTIIRGAALTGALTLAHAAVALAATGGENTPLYLSGAPAGHHSSGGGTSSSLVRTIVGLFIVIAVIYGLTWILRQFKGGKNGKNKASGNGLAEVASLPLGSGRSVNLVRVGHELLLLGVAEHSVTPLRTYTEKEALTQGLELDPDFTVEIAPSEAPTGRFMHTLRRMTVRS
jgi:flagellar protein FliO/FliZ